MILGWKKRYQEIVLEFGYSKKRDTESAILLNSILKRTDAHKKIARLVKDRVVLVIGSGPSLSSAIPKLKNYGKVTKIVADSAVKPLVDNGIIPDIIITDLDGDENTLKKIAKTKTVFVVHAHGDNMNKLELARGFRNCIGTTQSSPSGKIANFGGFTDGDRGVFLADHFQAKRIILCGMDFGDRIGRFSGTRRSERRVKLMKLKRGESLLAWLGTFTKSELSTTSRPIKGFRKISYKQLDAMIG